MAGADPHQHWQQVWSAKAPDEVSWYESSPRASLELIEGLGLSPAAPIIDVGGGASGLAGELLRRGYSDLTVADISETALTQARKNLGDEGGRIAWVVADVRSHDFQRRFRLWHDRAVFHFLVDETDRSSYLEVLARSLARDGEAIIATFGPAGPTSCSGLPVMRYSGDQLAQTLDPVLDLVSDQLETHKTPSGTAQQFLYAHLRAR